MPEKILVAYATRTGSTSEVAEAIAKRFCGAGFTADGRPAEEVADLDGYSAIVLGSAIRYAAWLSEMAGFLVAQRPALSKVPVAFFMMHMLAFGDAAAALAERVKYTAAEKEVVLPVDDVFFPGKIDPARLSFLDRVIVRMSKAPVGDKRDWPKIEASADALAQRLAVG